MPYRMPTMANDRNAIEFDLPDIIRHFDVDGHFLSAAPYGNGHINDTFATLCERDGQQIRYIQQRINHNVFKDPRGLMDNILRVTRHLQQKIDAPPGADPIRKALTVIPTRDGASCHLDPDGNTWRTYVFVEQARTYDVCTGPDQATEAARAFGRFQQLLTDLPCPRLHDSIPYFHHAPRRMQALETAIEQDPENRAATVKEDIAFALARKPETTIVTDLMETGDIPERITHNDTKLNNVMISDRDGTGICVIDLDTVMPGSVLYDFGDLVRTTTRTCREDEPDTSNVRFDIQLFEGLARGYLETAGAFLTPRERDLLAFAGRLITFTIGIRFLADYLLGDIYFKTHRPGQNLDRTRVQFQMIRHMEALDNQMQDIVRRCS